MLLDKLSLFSDGQQVSVSGSNNTTLTFFSKVIDLRANGQLGIDGMLRIWGAIVGTVNAKGSITTTLQTSDGVGASGTVGTDDGAGVATWTDVVSETQNGASLIGMFLPLKGLKRFIRLKYVSVSPASSASAATVAVKAGLVDQFDQDDLPAIADPFHDDLAALGDAFASPLDLSAKAASTVKSAAADLTATIKDGAVVGYAVPSNAWKVGVSGKTLTISMAASVTTAGTYTVTLYDGCGNAVPFVVTVTDS